MKRVVLALLLAMLAMAVTVLPAAATVHEITGKFCSGGHGNEFPPGLSGGGSGKIATPLFASGAVESVTPFAGHSGFGPGVLITFDFDNPNLKLAPHPDPTVLPFFVGDGTYLSPFVLEGGFTNCKSLRDG